MSDLITVPGVGASFFGFFAAAALWGAVNGAWYRNWKFAGAALILAIIFGIGALSAFYGMKPDYDPTEIRRR